MACSQGTPWADFLLGYVRSLNGASGVNSNVFRWYQLAAYLQDDWKVTPSLTLNLGIRYNFSQPIKEIDAKTQTFDFRRGVLVISRPLSEGGIDYPVRGIEQAYNSQPRVTHYKDFEPRIGFAWRPFGTANTVIRGGYGIFYTSHSVPRAAAEHDSGSLRSLSRSRRKAPRRFRKFKPTAATFGRLRRTFSAPPACRCRPYSIPADKNPYSQQWNLAVEHKWRQWLVQNTYAGKMGVHIGIRANVNLPDPSPLPNPELRRPYPLFGPILGRFQGQNTSYHALQSMVQRQYSSGFSFAGAYTYSHAIDLESREPSATMIQDPKNWKGSRGNSAYDVRHRFVASGIYDLPFGPGKPLLNSKGFTSKLVGGWQVNGIMTLSTGNYSTVTVGADRANVGAGFRHIRPDVLRNPNLPGDERTPNRWFDTNAFQLQPFGSYGNAGRNIIENPGQNTFDFSVFKNNQIREGLNLQFRAEFYNFFNHSNFLGGNTSIDALDFGIITQAAPPRSTQMGLKLIF